MKTVVQCVKPDEQSKIENRNFLKIMYCMGYSTSDREDRMGELERSLLEQMWQVLLQSNASETHCTLGAIKRFLFIIEGLTNNDIAS